jgi:hypothetical protein
MNAQWWRENEFRQSEKDIQNCQQRQKQKVGLPIGQFPPFEHA